MNIIIFTLVTSLRITGVGKYTFQLIQALQEIDSQHNFYILVNRELQYNLSLQNSNFHKIVVPIPHYPRWVMRPVYFIYQNFFDQFLQSIKPDVIHLPNPIPLFRNGNVSYVVTVHDVAEFSNHRHNKFRR